MTTPLPPLPETPPDALREVIRERVILGEHTFLIDKPGGYAKVAPHMKAGHTWYRFKFVKSGERVGMAYDGLTFVNHHWVIVPKPWRVLKE